MYYLRPKLQQLIHWIWLPVWGVGGQVIPKWWEPAERIPVVARCKGGIPEQRGDVWGAGGEPGQRGCLQTVCCLWECFHFSPGAPWPQRVSLPPLPGPRKHMLMCCINLSCHIKHHCQWHLTHLVGGEKKNGSFVSRWQFFFFFFNPHMLGEWFTGCVDGAVVGWIALPYHFF